MSPQEPLRERKNQAFTPLLLAAGLLFGGTGIAYGVAHWDPASPGAASTDTGERAEPVSGGGEAKGPSTIKMEPIVVNLDEGDQLRYLKVSLQLEVVPEAKPQAETKLPQARHEALMYLSGLHLSDIQGLLGKQRVLRELQRRIADAVGGGLRRIFFDEFVVQ